MRRQTLSLATCIVFVLLAVASKKKEPEKKISAATPTLAKLAANEKAMPTKAVTPSAHGDVVTYADMPGATNVARASAKERAGAWRITLSAPGDETFTPWSFAPGGTSLAPDPAGAVSLPSEWFDLADGPLKGAIVHLPGYIGSLGTPGLQCHSAEIFSANFIGSKAYIATEGTNPQVLQWACDTGRTGVKAPMMTNDFERQCRDGVAAKGGAVTMTNKGSVMTAGDCTHALMGSSFKCVQQGSRVIVEVF